jgi:hypothetical protein
MEIDQIMSDLWSSAKVFPGWRDSGWPFAMQFLAPIWEDVLVLFGKMRN